MKKTVQRLKQKKTLLITAAALTVLIGTRYFVLNRTRAQVIKTTNLEQTFSFVGRDAQGQPTEQNLTLTFTQAKLQPEVLIQGKRAFARNQKTFLVLNFNLTNATNTPLFLNLQDLVRWVESENVHIAPQVNQGNLEVRPQSTKQSNLGFVVPSNQDKFVLQIGELDSNKETFEVAL